MFLNLAVKVNRLKATYFSQKLSLMCDGFKTRFLIVNFGIPLYEELIQRFFV